MRIAHVTATFPPYQGGTGNVCYHNARELARRGHHVEVFTAAVPGAPDLEWCDGFTVHRLRPLIKVGNAPVLPGLPRALKGFEVVHLHYPFFGGEVAALAARLHESALVITYHQDVQLNGPWSLMEKLLRHTAGRLALRRADRVLFTSLDYGRASRVRPILKGHEGRIGELPNGVDADRFTPGVAPTSLRLSLGLSPEDQVALLVAGLDRAHYFKGVEVFLRALAQLPAHFKGVIVGDGDLRTDYQAMEQRLGLSSRVIFAGCVSDEELPNYYRLAGVTVLPSTTMGEAFGLVLVESMACGTPVIASDLPGVRTVVSASVDGLLVKPGDSEALSHALGQLLTDPSRHDMGMRGRTKVEARYRWTTIASTLEATYSQLGHTPSSQALPIGGRL